MFHSKQWHYSLHRDFQNCYSTRRSLTRFFSSNSSSNSSSNPTRAQYREFYMQKTKSSSSTTIQFQRFYPCVLQDIPGNSSCSRDIPDIPVIHDLPAFQAILQCSSISRESTPFQHSPIRMHILQFYSSIGFQKTPPSTSWAITDITNIHSFFKEREMLRYRLRCQDVKMTYFLE